MMEILNCSIYIDNKLIKGKTDVSLSGIDGVKMMVIKVSLGFF